MDKPIDPNSVMWTPSPDGDGEIAMCEGHQLRVAGPLTRTYGWERDDRFAFYVWKPGDQNHARGEDFGRGNAKAAAVALAEKLSKEQK